MDNAFVFPRSPLVNMSRAEANLVPPGVDEENDPGFDAAPLPAFNDTSNDQSAIAMLNKTMTFLWCIGQYCELPVDKQLEILQEAVRYITKSCPTATVQLLTFSRKRSSMPYQDNPVYVAM